jgi:hypothetical protein
MAGGTDGNLITYDASGDPAHVATGSATHVLTSNGAGAVPTFQAVPAGGITDCSIWRLNTSFTGDANPIASNLEEDDGPDYVRLGSAMTESSGIFTFPSTGFWHISFSGIGKNNAANNHMDLTIESVISGTSDNRAKNSIGWSSFNYAGTYCSTLFDVQNTTTHKCSFSVNHTNTANALQGDTNNNETCMIFTRLADT